MSSAIRSLPYFDRETTVEVGGESVEVVPYQIAMWVSVTPIGATAPDAASARFPVVLDTGFSGAFAITPGRLRWWAGLEWNTLPLDNVVRRRHNGVEVPHRRANLWLHPNRPGTRDEFDTAISPVFLELHGGIAVYGDGAWLGTKDSEKLVGPRLPLLGMRALTAGALTLRIDGAARHVWLDVPDRP